MAREETVLYVTRERERVEVAHQMELTHFGWEVVREKGTATNRETGETMEIDVVKLTIEDPEGPSPLHIVLRFSDDMWREVVRQASGLAPASLEDLARINGQKT